MRLEEPKCFTRKCKHFEGVKPIQGHGYVVYCKAFPNGIPDKIAYGDILHTQPYPEDGGIRFEKE